MSLVTFLRQRSPGLLLLVALTALLSGAFNAGLIAVVNQALHASPTGTLQSQPGVLNSSVGSLALPFLLLGLGKLVTSTGSQLLLASFSQRTVAQLRQEIVATVLQVDLQTLEHLGPARVTASLSEDVPYVAAGLQGVPALAVNAAQVAGGTFYLAWLSPTVLLAAGSLLLGGLVLHRWLLRHAFLHLKQARVHQDELFEMFRSLTLGIKELKLHAPRRRDFEQHLVEDVTEASRKQSTHAENLLIFAQAWNNLLFYLLLTGLLGSVSLVSRTSPQTVSGFILTALYLMGPVGALVGSFSYMERALIAFERIRSLKETLGQAQEPIPHTSPLAPPCVTHEVAVLSPRFERLQFQGISLAYPTDSGDKPFVLGPIDLEFKPGEVVFLVGGNGSGKSTLARLVCGLYAPDSGHILMDGLPIADSRQDRYRQLFSTVFCDFYLFERLLGLDSSQAGTRIPHYLNKLKLHTKVHVENGRFSSTALSTGQRKRLALLVAYLEDRPFCIFDEWAADQDPDFKKVFYHELLPELKAQGKTVLAISHDERYFALADRVLTLCDGSLMASEFYLEDRPLPPRGLSPESCPPPPTPPSYRTSPNIVEGQAP